MLEPQSVCLVVLATQTSKSLERCIRSAAGFVDSCVVVMSETADSDIALLTRWCDAKTVKLIKVDTAAKGHINLAAILQTAGELAARALLLFANEELMCVQALTPKGAADEIGNIEIAHGGFSELQPRLFPTTSNIEFHQLNSILPVQETMLSRSVIQGVSVKVHRAPQKQHRDKGHRLLEEAIKHYPGDYRLRLEQAKSWLKSGTHDLAGQAFAELIDEMKSDASGSQDDQEVLWQAHYLLANIMLEDEHDATAQSHFEACFELDNNRMEPLLRLAECYFQIEQFAQCTALCEVITSTDAVPLGGYFEPNLYRYSARLLLAESLAAEGEIEKALALAKKIKNDTMLSNQADQRLQELLALSVPNADAAAKTSEQTKPVKADPAETGKPFLTIGMATFDDFDGVYFSVTSIMLYHPEVLDQIEIVVVDNNPDSAHGIEVKKFCQSISQVRYIAAGEYKTTSIKERVAVEARGDYVLCIDCHVFMHRHSLRRLVDYFQADPDCTDLLHGPMVGENGKGKTTHMEARWNTGFFGVFDSDSRGESVDAAPFDIPGHGMAMFAFKRSAWPGYNLKFRGFGGEEGYISEKFRQAGGRVLCIPFLRWTHRFPRPGGTKYINRWEDRIRNYLIGWSELGVDLGEVVDHFSQYLGREMTAQVFGDFQREVTGPLWQFDEVFCFTNSDEDWQRLHPQLCDLSIERVTQRIELTDQNQESLVAAQKAVLEKSLKAASQHVVLINAQHDFQESARRFLHHSLNKVASQPWHALCLYGVETGDQPRVSELGLIVNQAAFPQALSLLHDGKVLNAENMRARYPELVIQDL